MTDFMYQWMDLIWLPIAFFVVHKHQRIKTFLFIVTCMLTLRLQVEIMESIDYPTGVLPYLKSYVYHRGLVVYGIVIALFLLLARFSPKTNPVVFLAAMISIYMITFCLSMLVMVF